MLSYIASNPMEDLIKGVCEELNITILSKIGEIDFLQYIRETKVNFKLIKYIIIELKSLKGTEENIINGISYFYEVYPNIRIIDGLSKKESKKFKKAEIIKKQKRNNLKKYITSMKKNKKLNSEGIEKTQVNNTSVYFFTLLIQAVDKLLELLGTAIIFGLTSLGLTIIFNESLRNIVFQMLGLK